MCRIAWTTDIHLNFLGTQQIETFLQDVKAQQFDSLIISGDIGEAPSIYDYLRRIANTLNIPIYFVLGNHDFYQSSIQHVRQGIANLVQDVANLHWLNAETVIPLNPTTALIGHDSWSDGRYGDFHQSDISLSDYVHIQELTNVSPFERLQTLHQLGDEAAAHIKHVLPTACQAYQQVFVVIHSPPFRESCWYEGNFADHDNPYLPHFTCKAVGDVLLEVAPRYPDCDITVLCGHTHGAGEYRPLPNLLVITGGADYGAPTINQQFILT